MPRKTEVEEELVFQDPPSRANGGNSWASILSPLTTNAGRGKWARVKVFDTPAQANSAQSNLSRRSVIIPDPDGEWIFAARGVELYAKYAAPSPRARPKARRK